MEKILSKTIKILYTKYYDKESDQITIGGVQTYITDLIGVIKELGCSICIYQQSETDFEHNIKEDVKVIGVKCVDKNRNETLYSAARKDDNDSLIIFATDNIIPKKTVGKTLAIQHGIYWDIPYKSKRSQFLCSLAKGYFSYKKIRKIKNIDSLVCVDYNFVNWYRTQVAETFNTIEVIPNYAKIADKVVKPEDMINIIFARRLFYYRGTRIFVNAIKKILDEKLNVFVTIAGCGPDEKLMREQLQTYNNVQFIQYESQDSLKVLSQQNISVVPTIGSEGTSLSLLESMSAQCAVVCSDVGGMTNIVLNGYNGLMVPAGDEESLYHAIKDLIINKEKRATIAEKGYETVKKVFSYEIWKEKWKKVLLKALQKK